MERKNENMAEKKSLMRDVLAVLATLLGGYFIVMEIINKIESTTDKADAEGMHNLGVFLCGIMALLFGVILLLIHKNTSLKKLYFVIGLIYTLNIFVSLFMVIKF